MEISRCPVARGQMTPQQAPPRENVLSPLCGEKTNHARGDVSLYRVGKRKRGSTKEDTNAPQKKAKSQSLSVNRGHEIDFQPFNVGVAKRGRGVGGVPRNEPGWGESEKRRITISTAIESFW